MAYTKREEDAMVSPRAEGPVETGHAAHPFCAPSIRSAVNSGAATYSLKQSRRGNRKSLLHLPSRPIYSLVWRACQGWISQA